MPVEELDLFSFNTPKFKIDKPIRLIETFAGIGSQAKALKNLGAKFEHWKVIEVDQNAINSYNAIHGTNFTTKDITQTHAKDLDLRERERYCYILTYSFPCQDLSLAGKGAGMKKGTSTRSGLLWEIERILDECNGELPQVLLMENVPQVIGKKNIKDFQLWRSKLESLGYSCFVSLLNAKNYGIPQNRNRCFMVSILGNYHYSFPKKMPLKIKLKDMLESNVDEKYYLSDKMIKYLQSESKGGFSRKNSFEHNQAKQEKHGYSPTLTTRECSRATDVFIVEGGVKIKNNNSKGYAIAQSGDGIDISSRMQHHRGTVQKGLSQTLDTKCNVGVIDE